MSKPRPLTPRQKKIVHEMANRDGRWIDPARGYEHTTWDLPGYPVSRIREIMWALSRKDIVVFDHYHKLNNTPRCFTLTNRGRAYAAVLDSGFLNS